MIDTQTLICGEILHIMATYHEQEARTGGVDSPGGLEHMGDVWRLFSKWEKMLRVMS
jgi:hypothetical protein